MGISDKSPGSFHILINEILGKPKADILECLIKHSKSGKFIPVTEISVRLGRKRENAKVYQYLSELKQDGLVESSGGRPLSYKIFPIANVVKRLTEIAEQQTELGKKKLDKNLIELKDRLSAIPVSENLPDAEYLPPRLSAIKAGQLDNALSESLDIIGVGHALLCEAPSITFLLPSKDFNTRFGRVLSDKLAGGCISEVRLICNRESSFAVEGSSPNALDLLERDIKEHQFSIVFSDQINPVAPITTIFGARRAIISLAHAVKNQAFDGFLMEGSDTIRAVADRFSKTFADARRETISRYLDDLRSGQRAGIIESETVLAKIIDKSGEKNKFGEWRTGSWKDTKDLLMASITKEEENQCLKDHNLRWLTALRKKICAA